MTGGDFNALFLPMKDRGGIVQYDKEGNALDPTDQALVEQLFADRRGASYFFVVARSSPEGGGAVQPRPVPRARRGRADAPAATRSRIRIWQQQVGLLWLGEEFAQLEANFCDWRRSGDRRSVSPKTSTAAPSWRGSTARCDARSTPSLASILIAACGDTGAAPAPPPKSRFEAVSAKPSSGDDLAGFCDVRRRARTGQGPAAARARGRCALGRQRTRAG